MHMHEHVRYFVYTLIVALILNLWACAPTPVKAPLQAPPSDAKVATVYSNGAQALLVLTFPQTLAGLKSALAGNPGTFIMYLEQTGEYYVGWPVGADYGVAILDKNLIGVQQLGDLFRAQKDSPLTVTAVLELARRAGGRMLTPELVPPKVVAALQDLFSWAQNMGTSMVTIFVLPIESSKVCPPDWPNCTVNN